MGDRIALLKDGRLVQTGTGDELYYDPVDLFAAGFFSELNLFESVVGAGMVETPVGRFPAGALADGDIGSHFPPSDPQWKGAASHIFLAYAAERVRARGGMIAHIDAIVIAERPKVGPHRDAIRAKLAEIMGMDVGRVAVKATTSERLGFTGREEGIAAMATATVRLPFGA